jgi:bisphosphoglycerate-independent phosphoglycerate mutase (AlkP superfamily)
MAEVSGQYDFSWFDYWISDYAGHKRDMARAVELLEDFDKVLGGLAKAWESRPDLLVLTSDHGNLEDLNKRGHTNNPVPAMLLGPLETRRAFSTALNDLSDFAPAVLSTIFPHQRSETDSAEEIRVEEGGRDE